jgi:hypothetical protein
MIHLARYEQHSVTREAVQIWRWSNQLIQPKSRSLALIQSAAHNAIAGTKTSREANKIGARPVSGETTVRAGVAHYAAKHLVVMDLSQSFTVADNHLRTERIDDLNRGIANMERSDSHFHGALYHSPVPFTSPSLKDDGRRLHNAWLMERPSH